LEIVAHPPLAKRWEAEEPPSNACQRRQKPLKAGDEESATLEAVAKQPLKTQQIEKA
jgi:hypothetical protein